MDFSLRELGPLYKAITLTFGPWPQPPKEIPNGKPSRLVI